MTFNPSTCTPPSAETIAASARHARLRCVIYALGAPCSLFLFHPWSRPEALRDYPIISIALCVAMILFCVHRSVHWLNAREASLYISTNGYLYDRVAEWAENDPAIAQYCCALGDRELTLGEYNLLQGWVARSKLRRVSRGALAQCNAEKWVHNSTA